MIHLTLLTPKGTLIDDDVDSFAVPSRFGKLVISGGYTPIFEMLDDYGVLKVTKGKDSKYYAVFFGTLRVEPMKALLCCESCEDGYDIDMARANESLARAQDRLLKKQEGLDIKRAEASLGRALARISAKKHSEGNLS